MEENNKKRKANLLTFILIGAIVTIVIVAIVGVVIRESNKEKEVLADGNDTSLENEEELLQIEEEEYNDGDYSKLYEKYSDEGIYWLVKDAEETANKYPNGAYACSYLDEDFEQTLETYVTNNRYKIDYNELDGDIHFIVFPIAGQSMEEVFLITDKGTVYGNYDIKTYDSFEFKKIIEFESEVIDIFEHSDKIREYDGMYFLLANGKIMNEQGVDYEVFDGDFVDSTGNSIYFIGKKSDDIFVKEDNTMYVVDYSKNEYVQLKDEKENPVLYNNNFETYYNYESVEGFDYLNWYFVTEDNSLMMYNYLGIQKPEGTEGKEVKAVLTESENYTVEFTDGTTFTVDGIY